MKLPKQIDIYRDTVRIKEMRIGELGYHVHKTLEIVINSAQPEAGKHIVLIHEMMHVIETLLIRNGVIKRRVNHAFITNAPAALLYMLIKCGLYPQLSAKAFKNFHNKYGDKLPKRREAS